MAEETGRGEPGETGQPGPADQGDFTRPWFPPTPGGFPPDPGVRRRVVAVQGYRPGEPGGIAAAASAGGAGAAAKEGHQPVARAGQARRPEPDRRTARPGCRGEPAARRSAAVRWPGRAEPSPVPPQVTAMSQPCTAISTAPVIVIRLVLSSRSPTDDAALGRAGRRTRAQKRCGALLDVNRRRPGPPGLRPASLASLARPATVSQPPLPAARNRCTGPRTARPSSRRGGAARSAGPIRRRAWAAAGVAGWPAGPRPART